MQYLVSTRLGVGVGVVGNEVVVWRRMRVEVVIRNIINPKNRKMSFFLLVRRLEIFCLLRLFIVGCVGGICCSWSCGIKLV